MTDTATAHSIEELTASLPEGPVKDLYEGGITGPDPYPIYRRMRAQGIIVYGDTHISRYADVSAVLRHPEVSSDARNSTAFGLLETGLRRSLDKRSFMHTDPPDHTRLRRLVAQAFTRRRIERLRSTVQHRVDEAIDATARCGRMDVVADLAYPLPVQTICHLLGVPVEDHLDLTVRRQLCCFDPASLAQSAPAYVEQMRDTQQADLAYWASVIEQRRREPGEDLISALIEARDEGDRLTDEELVNTVRLLFIGGHETTVSLIANGMLALLRDAGQLRLLREDPDLGGEAVEETLRYDAPFQFVRRTAVGDLNINGTAIAAGTQLMVWLAAANRDPGMFPEPDVFDIGRADKRHLGFGSGIHACLGGPLARMQGEIALRTMARRLAEPVLDGGPVYHDDAVHAIKSLPITFSAVGED